MKKIICLFFICVSIEVFAQEEIEVISFSHNLSDIAARTNQREDSKGIPCALVKVQLPLLDVCFDGDIAGEVAYKTNEYWVYMPEKSPLLEVKVPNCKPLVVNFGKHGITSIDSKETYELCLLMKEKDASQSYNDGMIALAKNDIATAFDCLQKASDSGYAPASYQLGLLSIVPIKSVYDEDPNSQEAYTEACNYFLKAANDRYPAAQIALAKILLDNNEICESLSYDSLKIWSLIEDAANQGNADAQWLMISDDQWCKDNANKGVAIAQFGMGLRYDTVIDTEMSPYEFPMLESFNIVGVENYAIASNWYQKAADKGLYAAQWRLGEMYACGLGVEKSINKAIELRTQAAEQGNYLFQFMMGIMYTFGAFSDYCTYMFPDCFNYEIKVSSDTQKADYWLRKFNHRQLSKKEKENVDSNGLFSSTLNTLASKLISEGKYENAIYWYQREIEVVYRDAYCKLGELYFKGWGFPKDFVKAREMFENADLDDVHFGDGYSGHLRGRAKAFLGVIYRDGLGVESDVMKAKTYLMASAEKNDAKGMYELAILLEREGRINEASELLQELKNGWGHNDTDDYYKNKANEAINSNMGN